MQSATAVGARHRRMASGAGHDTAWMARITKAAMIFIPCRDGRSHSPEEFAETGDIALGAAVLLEAVQRLDETTWVRILTEKDVEPAVKGGSVYAAGGGGWADHGRMLGYAAVSVGKPELVDIDELDRQGLGRDRRRHRRAGQHHALGDARRRLRQGRASC